jgi:hypothetical protein
MLLRIFKGTGPGVIILIIITLICIWMNTFIHGSIYAASVYENNPMPLYGLLKNLIHGSRTLEVILTFSIVSLMSFVIVNFNTNGFFISERTFLPALFYVLLGGLFPDHQLMSPVIPASVFLIFAMIRIMDAYHINGTAYNYFDAGILISTGSLFYANLIWFGILVIIGIALLRTGNLKEIFISILGLFTPYIITFGIYYVLGKDLRALISLLSDNLFTRPGHYHYTGMTIVALIFFSGLVLASIVQLFNKINTKKVKSRKTYSLLLWTFLISLIVFLTVPSASVELIWIIAIPVSYFLTHYFLTVKRKLVPELLFSLIFVFVVLIQLWHSK